MLEDGQETKMHNLIESSLPEFSFTDLVMIREHFLYNFW